MGIDKFTFLPSRLQLKYLDIYNKDDSLYDIIFQSQGC
jgi:hypothetical protein